MLITIIELEIIGFSPNNDSHIFKSIAMNEHVSEVLYYYYDEGQCEKVKKLLSNKTLRFKVATDFWNKW